MNTCLEHQFLIGGLVLKSECSAEAVFTAPADCSIFAGHFPGHPILPGMVLILLTRMILEKAVGFPLDTIASNRTKFLIPVPPEMRISVQVSWKNTDFGIEGKALLLSPDGQQVSKIGLICKRRIGK